MFTLLIILIAFLLTLGWLVWDFYQISPRRIGRPQAAALQKTASMHWTVSAVDQVHARETELAHRMGRVRAIFHKGWQTALLIEGIAVPTILILALLRWVRGYPSTFSGLLLALLPAVVGVIAFIAMITGALILDALGSNIIRSRLHLERTSDCEIYIGSFGIFFQPGGLLRFPRSITCAEVLDLTPRQLFISTGDGVLRQDYYLPLPKGKEDLTAVAARRSWRIS